MRSTISGVNFGLSGSIWLGSPGARWMIKKETTDTKKSVMVFCITLRPRNDSIDASFPKPALPGLMVSCRFYLPCAHHFPFLARAATVRVPGSGEA
jgi:hypothetical protein